MRIIVFCSIASGFLALSGCESTVSDDQAVDADIVAQRTTANCAKTPSFDGQLIFQDQSVDLFGSEIVSGDMNRDGFDDAVIGAPGKGLMYIALGTPDGPKIAEVCGAWRNAQNPNLGTSYGSSIIMDDFDQDGWLDLAVAAPTYSNNLDATPNGAVFVYNGSSIGLTQNQFLQGPPFAPSSFGWALSSGDYDGDGRRELVVGADGGNGDPPGRFHVYEDLPSDGVSFHHIGTFNAPEAAGFRFGIELASGDLNGDGLDDLVVASRDGLFLYRGAPLLNFVAAIEVDTRELRNYAIHIGDFIQGPPNDLVVSMRSDSASGDSDIEGSVRFFAGGAFPLTATQDSFASGSIGDVLVADVSSDGVRDVLVTTGLSDNTKQVKVFTGSDTQSLASQAWNLDQSGIGTNEEDDDFGSAIAAGDFNGDCKPDLLIGAATEIIGPKHPDNPNPTSGRVFYYQNARIPIRHFGQERDLFPNDDSAFAAPVAGAVDFTERCPTIQP